MPDHHQATWGQRVQLERISTAYWALVGEQVAPGAPITYRLVERSRDGSGRTIHELTPEMVASLLQEGWIESDGTGNAQQWGYRITPAGIRAMSLF